MQNRGQAMTNERIREIESRLEFLQRFSLGTLNRRVQQKVEDDISALLAEVEQLKELLNEYGRHQEGCNAAVGIDGQYPCKCGYEREVKNR
jgi:hypothetical protein